MRRESSPADNAGQTQPIEVIRVVVGDAAEPGTAAPRHWPAPRIPAADAAPRGCRARPGPVCLARRAANSSSHRMNVGGSDGRYLPAERTKGQRDGSVRAAAVRTTRVAGFDFARFDSRSCPRSAQPAASSRRMASSTTSTSSPSRCTELGRRRGSDVRQPSLHERRRARRWSRIPAAKCRRDLASVDWPGARLKRLRDAPRPTQYAALTQHAHEPRDGRAQFVEPGRPRVQGASRRTPRATSTCATDSAGR